VPVLLRPGALIAHALVMASALCGETGLQATALAGEQHRRLVRPTWSPERAPSTDQAVAVNPVDDDSGSAHSRVAEDAADSARSLETPQLAESPFRNGWEAECSEPMRSTAESAYLDAPGCSSHDTILYDDTVGFCDAPGASCDPVTGYYWNSDASWYDPSASWSANTCFPPASNRLWIRAEYLLWWTQGSPIPPLVTTSPPAVAGRLDDPTTTVLFGGDRVDSGVRSGARATLGCWLDVDQHFGVEADYLGIVRETARYRASSDGDPLLARPFFNIVTGLEDSHVLAFAPFLQGAIAVDSSSEFHSMGVWLRRAIVVQRDACIDGFDSQGYCVDFLLGYRLNRLDENLRIAETVEAAGPTIIDAVDLFDTENTFHGAEVGASAEFHYRRWSLELLMKLALGNTHSQVFIDGGTVTVVDGGAPTTDLGGLLALSTNMGTYSHDHFAVMPEFGITLGYDITPHLRATFGYTFLYWSRVVRPGDQIDRDLNPSFVPNNGPPAGAPRPSFTLVANDFWAQGMNFGLECRF